YVTLILVLPYIADWLYLSGADAVSRAKNAQRLDIWAQMWHAIRIGGSWGYGWTQVGSAQLAASLEYGGRLYVEHSHNIVLDLLVRNGPLVGSLIVLLTAGWLLRLCVKTTSLESVVLLMMVGAVLV